jgi:hypothetical protein
MELDNEMEDSVRTVNMMDASSRIFDMGDVAAAISEADELPVWNAANVEEYFPRERGLQPVGVRLPSMKLTVNVRLPSMILTVNVQLPRAT